MNKYINLARKAALKGDTRKVHRRYRIGAVGIRTDGVIVSSNNIPNKKPEPNAHAEARLVKKLNWGSMVYVVRIFSNGKLALAKPCIKCQNTMRLRGIKRCYYSINENEYGILILT